MFSTITMCSPCAPPRPPALRPLVEGAVDDHAEDGGVEGRLQDEVAAQPLERLPKGLGSLLVDHQVELSRRKVFRKGQPGIRDQEIDRAAISV